MKKTAMLLSLISAMAICAAEQKTTQTAAPAEQKTAQTAAPAQQKAAPAQQQAPQKKNEPGIVFCFARGLCNMTTGWLEIPRCMIYDNGFMPVFGLIVGIPEGAFLTVGRTLCGVYDIVSFGTSGSTCHGEIFPNTIFQSKWYYQKK